MSTLERLAVGIHGGPMGILADDLGRIGDASIITAANGARWVVPAGGGVGYRVTCAEIVMRRYDYEDGGETYSDRCGQAAVNGSPFCDGHLPRDRDGSPADLDALCEHQMPAWLCAGPNHYPPDNREDW